MELNLYLPLFVFAICGLLLAKHTRRRRFLPPGPKGWPIVGNLFDLPSQKEWSTWAQWSKQYSSKIISVTVLGQPIVILNDFKIAKELLDTRSAMYSDRPPFPMIELCGWGEGILLLRYGPLLRLHRRLVHKVIGETRVSQVYHIQEEETRKFLRNLMKSPSDLHAHIHEQVLFGSANIASIVLRITYGYNVVGPNDPLVEKVEKAVDEFSLAGSPAYLVNSFPALRYLPAWLPGASFKRTAGLWKQTVDYIAHYENDLVSNMGATKGNAPPSFVSTHLGAGEDENVVKYGAMSLYSAGSGTTVITIYVFFKAMLLYPSVQAKAQREIDTVIGLDRVPLLADRQAGKLPYIEAVLCEVFRWHTAFPSGLPHATSQDDVYEGHVIPKGAIVLPNLWQMCHDPDVYPSPEHFDPERFLGANPQPDPREIMFGFGRRVCVGRALTEASVFLSIAMTLAVFNVSKATCSKDDVAVSVEQLPGMVSQTAPFRCSIEPRSARALELLRTDLD
ncbi:cytochrome P450 [Hymenopellis radicata]|nr:cytochrome P450 [Hymenopellis radicata]